MHSYDQEPVNRIRLALCSLAFAAAGCGASANAPDATKPAIRTDRTEYAARVNGIFTEVTVGMKYVNRTGRHVYAHGCHHPNPPLLEQQVGDGWVVVFAPIVLLCLSPPEVIAPGTTYSREYSISGARPGTNTSPVLTIPAEGGTYRLVWRALRTARDIEDGRPLVAYSNEFRIGR